MIQADLIAASVEISVYVDAPGIRLTIVIILPVIAMLVAAMAIAAALEYRGPWALVASRAKSVL